MFNIKFENSRRYTTAAFVIIGIGTICLYIVQAASIGLDFDSALAAGNAAAATDAFNRLRFNGLVSSAAIFGTGVLLAFRPL